MAMKSKSRKHRSAEETNPRRIEEHIRRRAYELYEQRGRVDGFAWDDWLQAETELCSTKTQVSKSRRAKG